MSEQHEIFSVNLAAEGDGPPTAVRVRRFLKRALRYYGLRAVQSSAANGCFCDDQTAIRPSRRPSEQNAPAGQQEAGNA